MDSRKEPWCEMEPHANPDPALPGCVASPLSLSCLQEAGDITVQRAIVKTQKKSEIEILVMVHGRRLLNAVFHSLMASFQLRSVVNSQWTLLHQNLLLPQFKPTLGRTQTSAVVVLVDPGRAGPGWAPPLIRSHMGKIPSRATSYLIHAVSFHALLPLCQLVTAADLTLGQPLYNGVGCWPHKSSLGFRALSF